MWTLRIVVGNKRRDLGLGGYPAVTLAKALELARENRQSVQQGKDPVTERRAAKSALRASQQKQISFRTRAQAASEEYHRTGVSVPVETVLKRLQSKLDAKRKRLSR